MQSLEYNLILKLLFILLCINNSSLIAQPSPCNMSIIVIDGVDTIKFTKQNNNNQSFYFCFRFYNDTICEQVYSKIIYGPDRDAVAGQINDKYYYNIVISFQIPPPDFKLIIYHNSKKMTIDLLNCEPFKSGQKFIIMFKDGYYKLNCQEKSKEGIFTVVSYENE